MLIRSLTRWFQLVNLAEDNERVRRLRPRARARARAPRAGSLRDAVGRSRERGATAEELRARCAAAEVRLVHDRPPDRGAAAHDDREARARLRRAARPRRAPARRRATRRRARRLAATVQELWGSDELRAVSPTVLDEVRGGLVYFASTLARDRPRVYRELEAALAEAYPGESSASRRC